MMPFTKTCPEFISGLTRPPIYLSILFLSLLISPSFTYANCCVDNDDDGYADPLSCPKGTDCDDNDVTIFRGSVGCEDCKDVDGDRYLGYDPEKCLLGTDCNDSDAEKNPGKGNCNKCEDKDNDGYFAISESCPEGNDCKDDNSNINPAPTTVEVCGDGVDNNCDGNIDECCNMVLNYNSGNNQEGLICAGLTAPFEVKVADDCGSPKSGVGIEWNVTATPKGSQKAGVSNSSVVTSQTGVAFTYFTLGNYEGLYTVQSSCSVCSAGSPQTFTAKAICPVVPKYYQSDYPDEPYDNWCKYTYYDKKTKTTVTKNKTCERETKYNTGNLLLGYTQYMIAEKGCALAGVSMVFNRYGISYFPPDKLNQAMTVVINGYDKNANVKWRITDVLTGRQIRYIYDEDNYGYYNRVNVGGNIETKTVPKSYMDDYLKKCMPIVVQVLNPTTKKLHWVVVTGKLGDDYTINDPSRRNDFSLLSKYGDIYNIRPYKNNNGGCR